MSKKGIIGIVFVVLIGIVAYLYFSKKETKMEENTNIKIGVILPLSGDVAVYGIGLKNGMELALEKYSELNSNNTKIELIYEDSKADPKLAVSSFEKLTSIDKCKLVLGGFSSAEALSIAPIAEKNKIVLISPTASAPEITNAGDYIFRTTPSDNFDGDIMAKFAFNKLNLKKVAVFFENSDYGIGISKIFIKKFQTLGGEIAIQKSFESGTNDFKSQLLSIKQSSPDGLYIIADGEIGIILKQKGELRLNDLKTFTVGLAENPKVVEIAGASSNNVYYSYPSFQIDNDNTIVKRFVSSFEAKYNKKPDVLGAYGFDLMNITLEALKTNPSNSEDIKNALYKIQNFEGVTGETSFDKNGDVSKTAGIKVINNGNFDWYLNNFK